MSGMPPPGYGESGQARWYLLVLVLVVLIVGAPRISVEARFFGSGAVLHADGSAPVPQDDANPSRIDLAFRAARARLPSDATCVIARDSWNRDYFRASYLLMPRRVWPIATLLTTAPPVLSTVSASLRVRAARCLLAPAGTPIPTGWRHETSGAYSLYVPDPSR